MVQSSFFSDTPNYATSYPTQNDSNTNPVDGNSPAPSSFYPDGGEYEQNNPDVAKDYAAQAAASAADAASHDASAATHDTDAAAAAAAALASQNAAHTSETNAAASAASAASHDASAGTHDTNAASSAAAALASQNAAATSATNASTSATNAAGSATASANSATAAASSASAANTSATNAAASATAAATSASNAASAATTAANAAVAPLVGAIVFQGTWNASTNTPHLTSGSGTKGWLYKVSVAGSTAIDGISQWNVGDSIVFNGTTWDKIDGIATEVLSVAGRAGNVTLSVSDVSGAVPEAPSDGNEYARKNGAWALAAGAVTMQDTAPTGLNSGSLWWRTTDGQLFVLFGTTWVAASTIASLPGTVQWDVAQALSAAQQAQARANIGAQSVYSKNYIVNGAMMVSQENGSNSGTTGNGYFFADQFQLLQSNAGSNTIAQVASTSPAGSPNRARFTVTATHTSVAAGDYCYIDTRIEGTRVADLMFGSSSAKTVTLQFGVKAPAGTYCVVLVNSAANRSYVAEYTISAGQANTDTVVSITILGDVTGTWAKDNTAGLIIRWGLMVGSTFQQAAGSWGTGNPIGSANQFNIAGTNGNVFELFDVGLYQGAVAPSFQVPDYIAELHNCMRYFTAMVGGASGALAVGAVYSSSLAMTTVSLPLPMRTAPTLSTSAMSSFGIYTNATGFTPTGVSLAGVSTTMARMDWTVSGMTAGQGCVLLSPSAGAFLKFSARM